MKKFTFLLPLFNDWNNLKILIEEIETKLQKLDDQFDVIVLNDFSTLKCNISFENLQKIKKIKIINLNKNVGSQRSIAIGLKHISQTCKNDEKKNNYHNGFRRSR